LIPTRLISTINVTEKRQSTPSHLTDVDDGCGCVEVWEHTSEQREEESGDDADAVSRDDAGGGSRDDADAVSRDDADEEPSDDTDE
jgi:hypothetical protein